MFDRGFGPEIRKFLAPLNQRALKTNDQGFQTVLVTATMTTVCTFIGLNITRLHHFFASIMIYKSVALCILNFRY